MSVFFLSILFLIIFLVLAHAIAFTIIYFYLEKLAMAAKKNLAKKESHYDK